jgi:hypothetical protein
MMMTSMIIKKTTRPPPTAPTVRINTILSAMILHYDSCDISYGFTYSSIIMTEFEILAY